MIASIAENAQLNTTIIVDDLTSLVSSSQCNAELLFLELINSLTEVDAGLVLGINCSLLLGQ